jgi:hypothetical protein
MEITEDYKFVDYINQTESKIEFNKNLKVTDYFNYIYSYPSRIKIKWNTLDDLKEDTLIKYDNKELAKSSFSITNFIEDWGVVKGPEEAISESYSRSKFLNSFIDSVNSSNFFLKKTREIQSALANIPVFVVLNGNGEIVLSKPSNVLTSKTFTTYLREKLYDSCGAFDPVIEKKQDLGLIFMNYGDAEKFLKEVAKSDFEGTQTVGLSIHCINLNSAYKITREYHPGVDFRLVPDLNEVKNLLIKKTNKPYLIIENEQQQLRFRQRNLNLFPYLKKLGNYISPGYSFVQCNEYFKGVPIYVVKLAEEPRNLQIKDYFSTICCLNPVFIKIIHSFNHIAGFGQDSIIQGSLKNYFNKGNFENFIFFEKDQAVEFSKKNGRSVINYNGEGIINFISQKPKILVYNLEDFLEDWEDTIFSSLDSNGAITENVFNFKTTNFIPPANYRKESKNFSNSHKFSIKNLNQFLTVKSRILKRSAGIFFSL